MAGHKGAGHKKTADARQSKSTKEPTPKKSTSATEPKPEKSLLLAANLHIARPLAVRLLGVSDRTFRRLESEGVFRPLTPGDGRRLSVYDAPVVVAAYLAHRERVLTGSNESPRDRKDRSQAELNELRLARERREVLPRDQVVTEGQAYIKTAVAQIRALPSRMVRAGLILAIAEAPVGELLREALEELARWHAALGGDGATGTGA